MDRSLRKTRASDGQALLLAVLIMIAILLIGTLFVAVVNYNQRSSGRHAQLIKAMSLAKAGMDYANEMLQFSPQGLDWRPSPPPPFQDSDGAPGPGFWGPDDIPYTDDDYYSIEELDRGWYPLVDAGTGELVRRGFTRYPQMGGGHFLLRVTYDPDPPYEGTGYAPDPRYELCDTDQRPDPFSKYIKIESIGVTEDEGFVSRKVQAYKPVALTNYLLFVSDRYRRGYPTLLGYEPWIDMDKSGALDNFGPEYIYGIGAIYTYHGPMHFNTPVELVSDDLNLLSMITAPVGPLATPDSTVPGEPEGGGYLREDWFSTRYTVTNPDYLDSYVNDVKQQVDWLSAPNLFARDPATGTMRWDALTREAGGAIQSTYGGAHPEGGFWSDYIVNTAELGWMWDQDGNQNAGLYIDNYADLQHVGGNGVHYIDPLMQEWLNPQPDNGGWNALGEVYDHAPAVEIELFPTETATRESAAIQYGCAIGDIIIVRTTADLLAGATTGLDGNEIWWPNHNQVDGEPGIRLTRGQWSDGDDDGGLGAGEWALGDPSHFDYLGAQVGRTMYVDYPADGRAVIFAEGNVRIKGRLPAENAAGTGRQYHLTVVSGGTIYIDGQILSPQDQYGRDVDGSTPALISDEENTYIALLARDCVVVNPTMLVPQFDKKQTTVVAQNDPGENYPPGKHWQMPPSNGAPVNYAQSQFYFGAPPTGDVRLTAYQGLEGEGGVTSTTIEAPVIATQQIITVADDVSAWDPPTHQLLIIHGGNPALQDVYNFTAAVGNQISLSPNAVRDYPIGSEVINLSLGMPAVTGIELNAYNPVSGWVPYDFDIPPFSASPPESIYVLTRKYLGPYSDPPWVWEGSSVWAPLQDTYWPWLLNGYIDPGPGALNALEFVMPTSAEIVTANGGRGDTEPYLLKKFKLQEFAAGQPVGTIHAKINAVMYAQNGCFFVIPGRYFKEDVLGPNVKAYLRYNYDVEIRGAITENFHPAPAVVREWQEKWAYPDPITGGWNSIRYVYDETLLAARTQPITALDGVTFSRYATTIGPHSNTVKVPLLPASPDLLYYGEAP